MLGLEVEDEVRGRTFAFVQSLIRVSLVLVLAISPLVAAAIGEHTYSFRTTTVTYNGAAFTMFFAGLIAVLVGVISYRQMRDRPNVSLLSDIKSAFRGELGAITGQVTSGKPQIKSYLKNVGESSCKWCPYKDDASLCDKNAVSA